ncbi:ABC transporter ATP-binding protein [Cryobacterium sp. Y50]|uniref:ABC transporter ATP-binding protein n=1 Tax=Cryobacterium sp. Y50 TaxID=2048286 RepID=UPI000CE38CF4|nr:ATP-binding cassette domain-containing protein [Cryobacterium sp. Y50]
MSTLFTVDAVRKRYRGAAEDALGPVSLSVEAGRHLAIIGESGSGKTTLSRIMLGLLPPTAGVVQYRGTPVHDLRGQAARDLRRRVQLVLQDPFASLSPRMRVGDIVAEPLRILHRGVPVRTRVAELLAAVELDPSFARRFPHELSGGQRQRVAIARALGPRPEVLVADEPVSALDVSVQAQILRLLRRLAEHEALTLVLVSHDLGIVQNLCHTSVVMHRGRIVEFGATTELLADPQHPYTRELLASVPALPQHHETIGKIL